MLGCATYSSVYGDSPATQASLYHRMTRLALRYGITAFDTAPHYHPSEIILGKCLYALRDEFPRNKYSIITKCGKYSPRKEDHVLDEDMLRACVDRSLRRFMTDYLDVVCKSGCLADRSLRGAERSIRWQIFTMPSSTRPSLLLREIQPGRSRTRPTMTRNTSLLADSSRKREDSRGGRGMRRLSKLSRYYGI